MILFLFVFENLNLDTLLPVSEATKLSSYFNSFLYAHPTRRTPAAANWKSFRNLGVSKPTDSKAVAAENVKKIDIDVTPLNETPINRSFNIYLHNVKDLNGLIERFTRRNSKIGKNILNYKKKSEFFDG